MERVYAVAREPILLGRTGEDRAREIAFDIGAWRKTYGEGNAQLLVRRSGEEFMYPAVLRLEGDLALWIVTRADVAKVGRGGECELGFVTSNGAIAKGEVWETVVLPSMTYEQEEVPRAEETWLDETRRVLAEISKMDEKAREDIVLSRERAREIAQASSDAQLSATKAEAARRAVENLGAETVTLASGTDARVSKKVIDGAVKLIFGIPGGKSAYQYAVDVGYDGTEAEFTALLAEKAGITYVADGGKPDSFDNLVFDGGTPFTTDELNVDGGMQ